MCIKPGGWKQLLHTQCCVSPTLKGRMGLVSISCLSFISPVVVMAEDLTVISCKLNTSYITCSHVGNAHITDGQQLTISTLQLINCLTVWQWIKLKFLVFGKYSFDRIGSQIKAKMSFNSSSTFSIQALTAHPLSITFCERSREVTQEFKICPHILSRTSVGWGEQFLWSLSENLCNFPSCVVPNVEKFSVR